jgi:hypothetical protein
MSSKALGAFLTLSLMFAVPAAAEDGAAKRMLERIAALAGDWEGTLEWSGARTGSGPIQASYHVTGNGSAVVENLIMGGMPMMTTVYHLDGEDLRMTHYCAAQNQPRLRAEIVDDAAGVAHFAFVDVTNVGPKNRGYVEAFDIGIAGPNQLELVFVFRGGGPRAVETIKLRRIAPNGTKEKTQSH